MTQIDSLDLPESWTVRKARQWLRVAVAPKEPFFFSKGDLRHTVQGPCVCSTRPRKRDECGHDLCPLRAPHRPIKGVKNKVAYRWWPSTNSRSGESGQHSALRLRAGNWAPVNIVAQDEPPILMEPQERKITILTEPQARKTMDPSPLCLQHSGRPAKHTW